MDTGNLPTLILLLGISLVAFTLLSIAEHAENDRGGGILRDNSPNQQAWFLISPFKYACIVATVLSGFFLIRLFVTIVWLDAAIIFLASLVVLTVIHRMASAVATRHQGVVARFSAPLIAALPRNGGSGNEATAQPQPAALDITEEDLVSMDRHDREMLRSIIQLDNSTAHEIMVPRLDVVALDVNTPIREAVQPIINSGHTRIPVFEDNIDHVIGLVHSIDLLQLLTREDWSRSSLREMLRQPFYIHENMRLDSLLEEFQQRATQMAIVVDEFGGTEGIITLEDLLEEIVGEIEDEFSWSGEDEVVHHEDGSVLVNASVTNDVIEEMFNTTLGNPDVDTIGGYVYMTLGRMPHVEDEVETDELTISIHSVIGRRIHKVRIQRKAEEPAQA